MAKDDAAFARKSFLHQALPVDPSTLTNLQIRRRKHESSSGATRIPVGSRLASDRAFSENWRNCNEFFLVPREHEYVARIERGTVRRGASLVLPSARWLGFDGD